MSSSPISSSSSDAAEAPEAPAAPLPAAEPLFPLFDVTCTVDFILGTGTVKVRDCVGMASRTVVRLEQAAGSDIELRVHGQSLAHGEVVVVDDNTALRINRVVPPAGAPVES